jgi:hypothetical protein
MSDYDNRIRRVEKCCRQLAETVPVSDATLEVTVDKGTLVKIEGFIHFRSCRSARSQAQWARPILIGATDVDAIFDHITPEFEEAITDLTGKFGAIEVDVVNFKVTSLIIKMSFCRTRRRAACW